MDIIRSLAPQVPIIVASLFLLMAATQKAGREKGATLILLGAIVLCLVAIAGPVVILFVPRVITSMGLTNIQAIYLALQLITSMLWAGAIALISIGIFLRPPATRDSYPSNVDATMLKSE
ncbi:MAG: hypothetical protein ACQESR_22250 [Planctomycetota bacterium]